ncbi:MAG: hypothetical protein ACTSUE_14570 [Promethearchaeota archaeon]
MAEPKDQPTSDTNVTCDVLIVGGSFAGNFLGWLLGHSGLRIHVVEEHEHIGLPMECAGIVSSKFEKLVPLEEHVILNRITGARIVKDSLPYSNDGKGRVTGNGETITIKTNEKPLVIDRVALDVQFHDMAVARGIIYHLGEKIIDIERTGQGIIARSRLKAFRCSIIVGCDGASSIVAQHVGVNNTFITGKQWIVAASRLHELNGTGAEQWCELHFNKLWRDLFAWVIPRGDSTYRVGLASRRKVAKKFDAFFRSQIGVQEGDEIKLQKVTGGTVPLGIMKKCAFNRILLLGDAACHVKASTGGGLVMIAISARYAARAIKNAFRKGKFTRKFLRHEYERPCRKKIGLNLKLHFLIRLGLSRLEDKDYDLLFSLSKSTIIRELLVKTSDMDFPLKFFIRILFFRRFYKWLFQFLSKNPDLFITAFNVFLRGKEPAIL